MTLSLYSTLRAWRRDLLAEKAASAKPTPSAAPAQARAALACLGLGLAGIACGGDVVVDTHA